MTDAFYHTARKVGENSRRQMVARDGDLSNDDDFYSHKIRTHCFLVLIRNSQDAGCFYFFFSQSEK